MRITASIPVTGYLAIWQSPTGVEAILLPHCAPDYVAQVESLGARVYSLTTTLGALLDRADTEVAPRG